VLFFLQQNYSLVLHPFVLYQKLKLKCNLPALSLASLLKWSLDFQNLEFIPSTITSCC